MRYTRKRKLPRPKCLPPEAATHRGECETGAGASLRASALIERVTHSRPGDREADRECFRLSKAGRDLCREELSCRLYNAQNPAHDLCLSDRYHAISPEERATWKTESECRDLFSEHLRQLRDQGEEERAQELWDMYQDGRLSMPDAIYTRSDGVTVAYEVITNHYGEAEISAKEEAAEALGATIEYYRA